VTLDESKELLILDNDGVFGYVSGWRKT